jgi:hypothetical protein
MADRFKDLDRRARTLSPELLDTYLAVQRELVRRGEKEEHVRAALERFLREHKAAAPENGPKEK